MFFHIDDEHPQADKCVKYRIITKVVYCVLCINIFEQQCAMLKTMLHSPYLNYHMKTICIDQSLRNSAIF